MRSDDGLERTIASDRFGRKAEGLRSENARRYDFVPISTQVEHGRRVNMRPPTCSILPEFLTCPRSRSAPHAGQNTSAATQS